MLFHVDVCLMLKLSKISVSKPHQSTKNKCGVHTARNTKPGSHGQQEADSSSTLVPSVATLLIIFNVCLAIKGKGEALLSLRADGARGRRQPALCVPTSGNTKTLIEGTSTIVPTPLCKDPEH